MDRVGYLGPKSTFSEEAALCYAGNNNMELVDYPSLVEIFTEVVNGQLDEGVFPVENSTEGSIATVLDFLAGSSELAVRGELILPVEHCLMTRPGVEIEQVEKVLSHQQALAQCREFLYQKLNGAALVEYPSTAAAAQKVAESTAAWAALAPKAAAKEYGLQIAVPVANDCTENATRFWIIGRERLTNLGKTDSKTSIILTIYNRPGALYSILHEFAIRNINLTRIESRPAKKNLGDYLFFIDFTGNLEQPDVLNALENIKGLVYRLKVLGSYPSKRI